MKIYCFDPKKNKNILAGEYNSFWNFYFINKKEGSDVEKN
jgi:hypothetical protein